MGQAAAGEQRQLLAAHEAVHQVDGRDARLDEIARQGAPGRIDGHAVDAQAAHRRYRRLAVDRAAHAVEDATQHVRPDVEADRLGLHGNHGIAHSEPGCGFEHFDDHAVLVERCHAAQALDAVAADDLHGFVEADVDGPLEEQQRAFDTTCDPLDFELTAHGLPLV